jgi:hypothetical protein
MATRVLPGAYVTLNDLSQFPEGATSLTVGYVLKCNRGDMDKPFLVTSPSDFLAKTTLTGVPSISDDPTYWSILKVLAQTNQVYIARAANEPKYGGAVLKKKVEVGTLTTAVANTNTLTITGTTSPAVDSKIIIKGTVINNSGVKVTIDGLYTVKTVSSSSSTITIVTDEDIEYDFTAASGDNVKVYVAPVVPLSTSYATPALAKAALTANDSMMIIGKNPGAYNGELEFDIVSATDNTSDLVYYIGANVGATPCTFDTMQLTVRVAATKEVLETFLFSLDPAAKTIDGISLFVDNVVEGSSYIQVLYTETAEGSHIPASFDLPVSTAPNAPMPSGAGSNGNTVEAENLVAALDLFRNKTIPVSILGNGCSAQAETATFQTELIKVAEDRKDIMVFLNSRKEDENYTINVDKAQHIVDYKKGTLASTSFYGCMYAPHVNASDTFNTRQVKIGTDGVAIAGWLNVINNLNYPYAYAGPQNGLVSGVTCDWKIGDESGEAQLLNDASINYVAFDGKVGRYYMQCQNTLQIANSSLRNIGCVLNVLDIKEHLGTSLKEYGQLPITNVLRRDILNAINDYLAPMTGTRFYNYSFQDVTTDADIAQDTLRYLLTISLTRYASKIYCAINVVNSTFDFSLLASV